MYKVIIVDNFGRDTVSDQLYKDNLAFEEAWELVKNMNEKSSHFSSEYYEVVDQDAELWDHTKMY